MFYMLWYFRCIYVIICYVEQNWLRWFETFKLYCNVYVAQHLSSNHWVLLAKFSYWSMVAIATLPYNSVWWFWLKKWDCVIGSIHRADSRFAPSQWDIGRKPCTHNKPTSKRRTSICGAKIFQSTPLSWYPSYLITTTTSNQRWSKLLCFQCTYIYIYISSNI